MRQALMRDRYSFKLTDGYILDRIYDKSYFSNNSRTTEPIVDILKRYRWIVLLSEPGSGKTSSLRYFAHSTASNILNSRKK
jgi:predicted NACHT family NTPase